MKVSAWNNGAFHPTGAGYGLRLDPVDRDRRFDRSWADVTLDLPHGIKDVRVKLLRSFWRDCPELRSAAVGRWLIAGGHRRWPRRKPPVLTLTHVSGNHFRVGQVVLS